MGKALTAFAIVIALVSAFVWGWCVGGRSSPVAGNAAVTDTLWVEVHDTCWQEVAVNFLRTDTVRLATVSILERVDTIAVHDSVYVEVPIERKVFTGENYRITAHGYRVGLDEVHISYPIVTATRTQYRTKRWNFNVGAQVGYGYTVHGASPYAGIGVAFGYTF